MTKQSRQLKEKLFEMYSKSAVLSGYSATKGYFCPLCGKRFDEVESLTLDHVPLQASDPLTVTVLTCGTCNSGSGTAQDQLLQRHIWLQLKRTNQPTKPRPCRLTLQGTSVNAAIWRDENANIMVDIRPKHNKPESFETFRGAYKEATGSTKIRMEPVIELNEPQIRWALVREAYLLLFYHWGYWLLKHTWESEVQELLKDVGVLLSAGYYVSIPQVGYAVKPTNGEFSIARIPSGQRCWSMTFHRLQLLTSRSTTSVGTSARTQATGSR
ncbi:hypothetical protein MYX82_04825 [Acidobacteria bacterium AH-259-D05]|nr:hypothetical protein [Acidobacteria bacterium AH-259-D05]